MTAIDTDQRAGLTTDVAHATLLADSPEEIARAGSRSVLRFAFGGLREPMLAQQLAGDMALKGGLGNVPLGVLSGCKQIGGRVLSRSMAAASLRRAVPA